MVLVIGNHSSGKSTFINHIIGQPIQKSGRAPTDCSFTILVGGDRAQRLDGFALMRQEKSGFSNIKQKFGSDFVSQIEMKIVENSKFLNDSGVMLVDSPGMIDPPNEAASRTSMDRGAILYQALINCWGFGSTIDRADVVLVMFDPDKPGTTFETLHVLTTGLLKYSSKLLLILNKVDDFETVHDFARAYGALCWNLSKVIPRKDLPFIYTMYVPRSLDKNDINDEAKSRLSIRQCSPKLLGTHDGVDLKLLLETEFDGIRSEVMREAARAPDRSTDAMLDSLRNTSLRLKLHCNLLERCKDELSDYISFWEHWRTIGAAAGIGLVLFYLARTLGKPSSASTSPIKNSTPPSSVAWQRDWAEKVSESQPRFKYLTLFKLVLGSCVPNVALWRVSMHRIKRKEEQVQRWLPGIFKQLCAKRLQRSDREYSQLAAVWGQVQPDINAALESSRLDGFPEFDKSDMDLLDNVLDVQIPRLEQWAQDRDVNHYKSHAPE
ncbi:unnamed protein product [Albugo candida]|uniref:Dynamin N-terminal domain-containing protein n=1 Tax=Albugo candida TaxID=65357 RepID=A0A024G292_9STRA|nr:unnamed protein product [Albugo candida]|eukprot:CCI40791.1 unnamed protein product [Albugo candida]